MKNIYHLDIYQFNTPVSSYWEDHSSENLNLYKLNKDISSEFCHRVTEAISNGWKLYGEPKMTFNKKRGVMRCAQAVIKNSPKKKYSKKMKLSSI